MSGPSSLLLVGRFGFAQPLDVQCHVLRELSLNTVDLLTKYLLKPASEVTLGMLCQLGDGGQGSGSIDKLSGVAQLD